MKKLAIFILFSSIFHTLLHAQIESTFNYSSDGQRVCLVDVMVDLFKIVWIKAQFTQHFHRVVLTFGGIAQNDEAFSSRLELLDDIQYSIVRTRSIVHDTPHV